MGILYARTGGKWVPVAQGSADQRWFSAWGIVATTPPNGVVTVPAGSAPTVLTPVLNFTTIVGRRYRLTFLARATQPASAPVASNLGLFDGATDTGALSWWAYMPAPYAGFTATMLLDGDGLAHAYTVRMGQNAAQAVTVWVDSPVSSFFIEDMGPVTGSSLIPQVAITPWTAPTLLNGWVNVAATTWAPAAYRKVGDEVQLRGLISRPTAVGVGAASIMFNLPSGFRPPVGLIVTGDVAAANYGGLSARIEILPSGDVQVVCDSASQNVHVYTSISNISFSVST